MVEVAEVTNVAEVTQEVRILEEVIVDVKPMVEPVKPFDAAQGKATGFAAVSQNLQPMTEMPVVSKQMFSHVQTELPKSPARNAAHNAAGGHYQTKIVDGKVYKIHAPTDPMENFLCDGCQ